MDMQGVNFRPTTHSYGAKSTQVPQRRESADRGPVEQQESVDLTGSSTPQVALDKTGQKKFANESPIHERGALFQFANEAERPERDGSLNWVLGGTNPGDVGALRSRDSEAQVHTDSATRSQDSSFWERGQAGALIGSEPISKPKFEDFGGAFIRS